MPASYKNNHQFSIGIDPDTKKCGYAIFDRFARRLVKVTTLTIGELMAQIEETSIGTVTYYVDAGWLNEGYHHYAALPADFVKWPKKKQQAYLIGCGVRVGRSFGVGMLLVAYLREKGHSVLEVRPTSAKWDAETLKRLTGWGGRTNPDSRDAAKLCFNR